MHNSAFNLDSLHTYIHIVCVYIRDLTVVDVAQRSALFRVLIVSNGLDKASRCDVSGGNSCVLSLPRPLSLALVCTCVVTADCGTSWQRRASKVDSLTNDLRFTCVLCVCTSKKMWTNDDFTPQLENVCQLY